MFLHLSLSPIHPAYVLNPVFSINWSHKTFLVFTSYVPINGSFDYCRCPSIISYHQITDYLLYLFPKTCSTLTSECSSYEEPIHFQVNAILRPIPQHQISKASISAFWVFRAVAVSAPCMAETYLWAVHWATQQGFDNSSIYYL